MYIKNIEKGIYEGLENKSKLLVMGNFNGKIEIIGGSKKVNRGGRKLIEIVKRNNLTIVNTLEVAEGV